MPKIDINLDPFRVVSSFFQSRSTASNVRSFCEGCNAKFSLIKSKVIILNFYYSFTLLCLTNLFFYLSLFLKFKI